jgi:tetratricopeptide (TPR) repeat protein
VAVAINWPTDPVRLLAAATRDFEVGRWDSAKARLDRVSRLRLPTAADLMLRARIELAQGRDEGALAALAQVPDDDPRGSGARLRRGQIELRRGRLRAAEAELLQALKLNPQQVLARRELIYIYGMQMRRQELGGQFLELSRLVPLTFDDLLLWGLARDRSWSPAEVEADLRRFVRADPEDRWSRLALAESLRQQGRLEGAEEQLALLPCDDGDALALRCRVLLERGDVAGAERVAVSGRDGHVALECLRGELALSRRDWAAAARHFQRALDIEPDRRAALSGMGLAIRQSDGPASARPFLEAARTRDILNQRLEGAAKDWGRDHPKVLQDLGAACEAAGRFAEARAWYRLAIGRDPLDFRTQQALYRLQGEARGHQRNEER